MYNPTSFIFLASSGQLKYKVAQTDHQIPTLDSRQQQAQGGFSLYFLPIVQQNMVKSAFVSSDLQAITIFYTTLKFVLSLRSTMLVVSHHVGGHLSKRQQRTILTLQLTNMTNFLFVCITVIKSRLSKLLLFLDIYFGNTQHTVTLWTAKEKTTHQNSFSFCIGVRLMNQKIQAQR